MKMSISFSLLFSLFLLIHTSHGHDITQILNKFPDFSTFNNYLTQTNLASNINSRQTITILVVDNANVSPLSSKSLDVIKDILSVHVILDYYDVTKLQHINSSSPLLTTLFQTTGLAKGQQGFLQVTHPSPDSVAFGSAMPGSTQGSSLIKMVASEPYDISVIQISNAIIPQGIDATKNSSPPIKSPSATPPPPPPPPPATATATPPTKSTATATPPSTAPPTPSKAKTPASSPPTKADAPSAAPGSAPAPGAPSEDSPTLDEPAMAIPKAKSTATALEIGLAVACTMALSTLYVAKTI